MSSTIPTTYGYLWIDSFFYTENGSTSLIPWCLHILLQILSSNSIYILKRSQNLTQLFRDFSSIQYSPPNFLIYQLLCVNYFMHFHFNEFLQFIFWQCSCCCCCCCTFSVSLSLYAVHCTIIILYRNTENRTHRVLSYTYSCVNKSNT